MNVMPEKPGPGQESVWEYPRPPRVDACSKHIEVVFRGVKIVDSYQSLRVLETSHPPSYYIPPDFVDMGKLRISRHTTICEWKGQAVYYDLAMDGIVIPNVAWSYPRPRKGYESLTGFLAFYPGLADACYVDGERVIPQPGAFYGGWITKDIVGPFKSEPGSMRW